MIRYQQDDKYPLLSVAFDQSYMTKRGIVFLKPMKVGGSSASGINLRISKNMAERLHRTYPFCENNFDHAMGYMMKGRNTQQSFLWTLLRRPTERSVSGFYHFEVSRFGHDNSDTNFVQYMNEQIDYYLRIHSFGKFKHVHDDEQTMRQQANAIMKQYDFMAITERFDESMVVLQMLLSEHNVTLGDILYFKAKSHGGYDDGGHKGRCTYIQPTNLTTGMKEFLSSEEYLERNKWDQAFYDAANRSLDVTIDRLGRADVERKVGLYRGAQKIVQEKCQSRAKFPCTSDGMKRQPRDTNCMFMDSGCAYECIDEVVSNDLMSQNDLF
jgi:hypothetical protein